MPGVVGDDPAQARTAIEDAGLVPQEVDLGSAPTPEEAGKVASVSPIVGAAVAPGTTVEVRVWGPYPQPTVPELMGQSLQQARTTLQDAGLELSRAADGVQGAGVPTSPQLANTVAWQSLQAGALAPQGTEVKVRVYGEDPQAMVPEVVGQLWPRARAILEQSGFQVASPLVGMGRPDSPELANTVFSQEPAARSLAPPGTEITLTVYGDYPRVTVPDLRGSQWTAARDRLDSLGLGSSLQGLGNPDRTALANTVKEQDPPAGSQVEPGTNVALQVYGDYVPPQPTPAEVGGSDNDCPSEFGGVPLTKPQSIKRTEDNYGNRLRSLECYYSLAGQQRTHRFYARWAEAGDVLRTTNLDLSGSHPTAFGMAKLRHKGNVAYYVWNNQEPTKAAWIISPSKLAIVEVRVSDPALINTFVPAGQSSLRQLEARALPRSKPVNYRGAKMPACPPGTIWVDRALGQGTCMPQ